MILMQELNNGYVIEMTKDDFKFNCPQCHFDKCYTLFVDKVVCARCKQIIAIEDNKGNCAEFLESLGYICTLAIPGLDIWAHKQQYQI